MTLHGQRHHDCHLGLDHLFLKEVEEEPRKTVEEESRKTVEEESRKEVEKEQMLLVSDHDCRLDLKWADYVDLPAK